MVYAPVTYKEEQLKEAEKYYAPVTFVEAVSQAYAGPPPTAQVTAIKKPPVTGTTVAPKPRPGKVPIERREIERIRERAKERPELVWKPPIRLAAPREQTRFLVEEVMVPPKGPRTVRALKRFKMVEEKLGEFRVPSEPTLWRHGVYEKKPLVKLVQPFKFPIGVAAPVEALLRPEVPTPIGAIFSEKQRRELAELGPFYVSGTLVGEYIVAVGAGKLLEKGWVGLKRVTPEFIKGPTYRAVKFGRPTKWLYEAKLRIKYSEPVYSMRRFWRWVRPKPIARGEVVIPDITRGALSLPKLEAAKGAWEMTLAPRTGGVWLGKYLVEPTVKKGLPHMFISVSKGFVAGPTYLKEYGFRREVALTPFVSQQQLTRMGIYPYAPKTVSTIAQKGAWQLAAGLGTTTFLRMPRRVKRKKREMLIPVPKLWQPTFALEREKYSPLKIPALEPKKREKAVPMPRLAPKIVQKTVPITIPRFAPPPPTPTIPTPAPFRPILPRLAGDRARAVRARSLFGKWFRREHPIVTAKKMAKTFGLSLPKSRHGKKRVKRTRIGGELFGF